MNNHSSSRCAKLPCLVFGLAVSVIATFSAPVQSNPQKSAQSPKFEQHYALPIRGNGLVLSHNGKFAAYFGSKANVTVVDLSTRKVLWRRVEKRWEVRRLAVSSNGVYLAGIGSEYKADKSMYMVYIINMRTKKEIKVPEYTLSAAFSPDSNSLLVASNSNNRGLVSYNVNTGEKIQTLWKGPLPSNMDSHSMKFSPDGKLLAVGSAAGSSAGHVKVWILANGKLRHDFSNAYTPIVFSPDSKLLATSAEDPQPEPAELPEGSYTESARFAFQDFAVKVWNLATGKPHILKHEGRQIEGTADPQAFSLDGRLLLTTNGDLWDVKTHKFIGQSKNLSKRGREIRFSRNGGFIIVDMKSKR